MEGIGKEVLQTFGSLVVIIICLLCYLFYNRSIFYLNEVDGVAHHRPNPFNHLCPICLEGLNFPLETNCGHMFCGLCLKRAHEARPTYHLLLSCPMCRQEVEILFVCFSTDENNEAGIESDASVVHNFSLQYNRFANVNSHSIWSLIRNTPILLRHYFDWLMRQRFTNIMTFLSGIFWFIFLIFYCVSPLDFLPESVFGLVGYLDDIFFFIFRLIHLAHWYRRFIMQE